MKWNHLMMCRDAMCFFVPLEMRVCDRSFWGRIKGLNNLCKTILFLLYLITISVLPSFSFIFVILFFFFCHFPNIMTEAAFIRHIKSLRYHTVYPLPFIYYFSKRHVISHPFFIIRIKSELCIYKVPILFLRIKLSYKALNIFFSLLCRKKTKILRKLCLSSLFDAR